jgi:hypothetical protein
MPVKLHQTLFNVNYIMRDSVSDLRPESSRGELEAGFDPNDVRQRKAI